MSSSFCPFFILTVGLISVSATTLFVLLLSTFGLTKVRLKLVREHVVALLTVVTFLTLLDSGQILRVKASVNDAFEIGVR